MAPAAYGIGGYDSVVSPMSLAIGWGLAFSTIVVLFLVPVLYSFAQDTTVGATGLMVRLGFLSAKNNEQQAE